MEKKPPFTPHQGPRPTGAQNNNGRRPDPRRQQADKDPYLTNERIRAREVRLVGDNVETGIYPIQQALKIADELGLDLIEISPTAEPPVCKILDYSKFLYQQKKRQKEQKQKAAKVVVKEIRFGPQTDEHDYQFKLKHAKTFLEEGNKVRAYVFFRGRSILFKEQGEVLLLRFANDLEEIGKVEHMPSLEGKKMFIYIAPKKAGVAKKSQQAMDREKKAAVAKDAGRQTEAEDVTVPANGGMFANAKISAEALAKLTNKD